MQHSIACNIALGWTAKGKDSRDAVNTISVFIDMASSCNFYYMHIQRTFTKLSYNKYKKHITIGIDVTPHREIIGVEKTCSVHVKRWLYAKDQFYVLLRENQS